MTQKQQLQSIESEKSFLHKHNFKQSLYSSQGEYVDGLEMRNRFEDYFPCYRIGGIGEINLCRSPQLYV